ncbi:putative toxin-antitoxin system toxin component, PIN family [Candidatus Thiodictyon syntrophicum]|jgi:putative PIN family toxin of toxin-antitoxin system|uniref:Putative toxin-antitoxin system toxin component, PIN family n=1 Tax=Candidatus Thiodictyon syntrophicum TaxID=1166950 RepID=A0A2K8U460_9GAMM|nr:putative toxin-antitoxin system toxin component, PIN family [Candidatus Thiodictyon syntrophicum]AUB80373.1 putative toxin-antitoxin system toxin component, PIN family [Candidatus Thiodictyon syntrophicum]
MRIVLDTSVLVAAARSRQGASYALVSSIPSPRFEICLSVSLYLEWQAVLTRPQHLPPGMTSGDAMGLLRYLAAQAHLQDIHFLWRPCLRDPDDDMVLELAVAARCPYIVTHNIADFRNAANFGVAPIRPGDFLHLLRSAS